MLMAVEGPYALMVQPDDILISPREVDEHFGTMICFHSRYALGDSHDYMDKDDFLREMYLDTVGHDEAGLKRYEHMVNIVSSRFRHGPKTEEQAVDDAMLKVISEKHIALLAVGGVGYYVKIVRPKQQAEDDEDFEDDGYGEGFDPDEAYGEPEYLSEDDFDDRIDDEQEDSE